ncbi:MAG: cytochrome c biogenesis protein CcdA [Planctomycetaceae bacterium]|nr:cytochrome c biogenesis protein CcdA [Planctomycetaceae bacterium]
MRIFFSILSVTLILSGSLLAQEDQPPQKLPGLFQLGQPDSKLDLNLNLGGGPPLLLDSNSGPVFSSSLEAPEAPKAGDIVTLNLAVKIPRDSYTYSQSDSFSGRTSISLSDVSGLVPVDKQFVPDHAPKKAFDPTLEQDLEKFTKDVTWSRKYRILPGVSSIKLAGKIRFQICNTQCIPYNESIEESLVVEPSSEPSMLTTYSLHGRPQNLGKPGPVVITFNLLPADAQPGEEVTLSVKMKLDKGWHAYAQSQEEGPGGTPTEFDLQSFQGLIAVDAAFVPNQEAEVKQNELAKDLTVEQHLFHDTITWSRLFVVDESAAETGYGVQGALLYQTCTDKKCLSPQELPFALGTLSAAQPISQLTTFEPIDFETFELEEDQGGLGLYLVYAFLGGLILNVMPCVLPVLAIKILSFVKQAGEDRMRVLQLNIAYSAGVILVFLCLATLAAFLEMGWGSLFQHSEFNLFMACLVFVMGLSLLGVFEIPIPGLAGGGAQKEGLPGAFLTGIFATFLATPCSGPFLGATLGWSVKQPTHIIYLIWAVMGLGMASPYLMAGFFPATIRWLPKPGAWMVRFKELSGFALMGAVIWIISYTSTDLIVPSMIMMMGLAFGLWMIGNLYDVATHINHKMRVRVIATLVTTVIVYFGFSQIPSGASQVAKVDTDRGPVTNTVQDNTALNSSEQTTKDPLNHGEHGLPWQDFSESALQTALRQKKTVLVDFTADWCLICKQNEREALNTPETLEVIEKAGIVTLYADFTNEDEFLKSWLKKFDSISVPLTVIFPGDNPKQPIIIRDKYSQSHLLEKLEDATSASKTAMAD